MPRSTFYYQVKTLSAGDKYANLKERIRTTYDRHKGRYGYRRITLALRHSGVIVNHKTVQRLMQSLHLKSLVRQKKYRAFKGTLAFMPNILNRQFTADSPNQKWVTDMTEFRVNDKKLYLCPIMDLYNGEIVAYQTSQRPEYKVVGNAINKAFAKLKDGQAPLLHSDQGWHYQMPYYRHALAVRGITQSMSRKGNCLDNAAIESFFGTLKSEFYYLNKFKNIEELESALRQYIHYYNHDRIRLKLKGLSPIQFRIQLKAA